VSDLLPFGALLFTVNFDIIARRMPVSCTLHRRASARRPTAALQKDTTSGLPILLIFGAAGHDGIGSPEDQRFEMATYQFEFVMDQLAMRWPEKKQP
jgi:hypothetical protein